MSDMTPDETLETPVESKPKMSLLRILLLLVLLIMVVTLFLDRGARSNAEEAKNKLSDLIDSEEENKTPDDLTPEVVNKLVGKEPDKDAGYELSSYYVQVYTWRGAFNTYSVHAGYRKGNILLLEQLSINERIKDSKQPPKKAEE